MLSKKRDLTLFKKLSRNIIGLPVIDLLKRNDLSLPHGIALVIILGVQLVRMFCEPSENLNLFWIMMLVLTFSSLFGFKLYLGCVTTKIYKNPSTDLAC